MKTTTTPLEDLIAAGTRLLDQGFPIIACDAKRPIGKKWQEPPHTAVRLQHGLRAAAEPSIGILMGPLSGIVDLETDSPDEVEAVRKLFDGCDPPITPAYASPRGKHTWYRYDPRLEALGRASFTWQAPDGQTVCIRLGLGSKASQSIIPPSAGRAWLPGLSVEDCDLAPLPELVIQRLLASAVKSAPHAAQTNGYQSNGTARPSPGGGICQNALRHMLASTASMSDSTDGSRRLFAVACRSVEHDLADPAAVATIEAYAQQRPFPKQWSRPDLIARIRQAERTCNRGKALKAPPALTDMGNGQRFASQHADAVRYVHAWNKWLVWDGTRWAADDAGLVMQFAKKTAQSIFAEAAEVGDADQQKRIASWAFASQSRPRLESTIELAKSEKLIPVRPAALDSQPWLLNCTNGTIDLKTGRLRPHDPADLITKTTGVEYPDEPGADCPLWDGFLHTIFAGNRELIEFVQRLLGSALVGEVVDHILPIFYGSGSNGKSVLLETVMEVLGDFSMKAPGNMLMASRGDKHPTELCDLFGMRLVAVSETGDSQRLDERLVKECSGGDTIRARRMREDFWEFTPSHLSILATNAKPVVRGTDHGIWRRLRLVPFTVTIPDEEQDPKLRCKLTAEHPAILKWLLNGCLAWQRDGLRPPPEVLAATSAYKVESDTFAQWFDECCQAKQNLECKASVVFRNYSQWCETLNERPLSQTKFGGRIAEQPFTKERKRDGYYYVGFAEKTQP